MHYDAFRCKFPLTDSSYLSSSIGAVGIEGFGFVDVRYESSVFVAFLGFKVGVPVPPPDGRDCFLKAEVDLKYV